MFVKTSFILRYLYHYSTKSDYHSPHILVKMTVFGYHDLFSKELYFKNIKRYEYNTFPFILHICNNINNNHNEIKILLYLRGKSSSL